MKKVKTTKKTGLTPFYQVHSAKGGKALSNHLLKSAAQKKAKQFARKTGRTYVIWYNKPIAKVRKS